MVPVSALEKPDKRGRIRPALIRNQLNGGGTNREIKFKKNGVKSPPSPPFGPQGAAEVLFGTRKTRQGPP